MSSKTKRDEPARSPIYFGPVSNGEFAPRTPNASDRLADRTVHRMASELAPRLGLSRRDFLRGPCGMAAALLTVNAVSGCRAYRVTKGMTTDSAAARAALSGHEFILDVQTHHIDATPDAVWPLNNPGYASLFDQIAATRECDRGNHERFACLSEETYLHEVFVKSDTAVAVLSGVPSLIGKNPLDNYEMRATRELVTKLAASPRLLTQGVVHPNLGVGELDGMDELSESLHVIGWKVYTPWGPEGKGWWLDDVGIGVPFLERAQKLKVPVVFCHKGLPWPMFDPAYCSPRDIGPVAKTFPDLKFVVYHSGYEVDVAEGPYDLYGSPHTADAGVNRLIKSLEDNGIWPNQNVYAELGGTWMLLMTKPVQAAHVIGKLLKHIGADRVLWGTDALFLGSPQPQLEAFRAFEIPEELQERHGYPALTPALKEKILGLNAAALLHVDPKMKRRAIKDDAIFRRKQAFLEAPDQGPPIYGPRTRRELFRLWAAHGGRPG